MSLLDNKTTLESQTFSSYNSFSNASVSVLSDEEKSLEQKISAEKSTEKYGFTNMDDLWKQMQEQMQEQPKKDSIKHNGQKSKKIDLDQKIVICEFCSKEFFSFTDHAIKTEKVSEVEIRNEIKNKIQEAKKSTPQKEIVFVTFFHGTTGHNEGTGEDSKLIKIIGEELAQDKEYNGSVKILFGHCFSGITSDMLDELKKLPKGSMVITSQDNKLCYSFSKSNYSLYNEKNFKLTDILSVFGTRFVESSNLTFGAKIGDGENVVYGSENGLYRVNGEYRLFDNSIFKDKLETNCDFLIGITKIFKQNNNLDSFSKKTTCLSVKDVMIKYGDKLSDNNISFVFYAYAEELMRNNSVIELDEEKKHLSVCLPDYYKNNIKITNIQDCYRLSNLFKEAFSAILRKKVINRFSNKQKMVKDFDNSYIDELSDIIINAHMEALDFVEKNYVEFLNKTDLDIDKNSVEFLKKKNFGYSHKKYLSKRSEFYEAKLKEIKDDFDDYSEAQKYSKKVIDMFLMFNSKNYNL